jgi:hypothetical protein
MAGGCDVPRKPAAGRRTSLHTLPLPTGDPRAHPAYPGQPRTATTSHDDGRAKPTSPLAQHSLRQLERQAPTRQTTSRSWTRGATTPTRWAQPCGGLPTAALPNLTSTGHRGRGDARTADAHRGPDAEHRRPASGHLDAQTSAPDTGHRSRGQASVDTGRSHRTLDAGRWPGTRTG